MKDALVVVAVCMLAGCQGQDDQRRDIECAATSMLILGTKGAADHASVDPLHRYYVGRLSSHNGDWVKAVRREFIVRKSRGLDQWRKDLLACHDPWMHDMKALSEPLGVEEFEAARSNTSP